MFITHRKGLTLDGSNPTLLYGYGEPGWGSSASMHACNQRTSVSLARTPCAHMGRLRSLEP